MKKKKKVNCIWGADRFNRCIRHLDVSEDSGFAE